MSPVETIGEFILSEMKKRHLSLREFARQMGSTHTTLSRVIEHGKPQIDFLMRLSDFTHISLERIVAIAYPESVHKTPTDSELLAERIQALPALQRQIVIDLIDGVLFQKPDGGLNKGNAGWSKPPKNKT